MIVSRLFTPILLSASAIAAVLPPVAEFATDIPSSSEVIARVVVIDLFTPDTQTPPCNEDPGILEKDASTDTFIIGIMSDQTSNEGPFKAPYGSHPLETGHGPRVKVADPTSKTEPSEDTSTTTETKHQAVKIKSQPFGSHPFEFGHGPRKQAHNVPAGSYGEQQAEHQESASHQKQGPHPNDLK